jgi:plastocyanin
MRLESHRGLVAALATPLVALLLVSCLSERPTEAVVDTEVCNMALPSAAFGSTVVIIRNFAFSPAEVRVRPGSKVTWVNCGAPADAPHTSTADAGAWSSPLLPPGQTFTREFTAGGAFPYHCAPHPGMKATVVVE